MLALGLLVVMLNCRYKIKTHKNRAKQKDLLAFIPQVHVKWLLSVEAMCLDMRGER